MNVRTPSGHDCFVCGSEMDLISDSTTGAYDGDEAVCEECGARGWLSADSKSQFVNYDEADEWNVRCAELYEARAELETVNPDATGTLSRLVNKERS
jgi:hypothetical protein